MNLIQHTDPIIRLAASYGIQGDRLLIGSKLDVEAGQPPVAALTFTLDDSDFRVMAGSWVRQTSSELTLKLDAAEGLAAMRAAMQPGAVLLSPEAICSLFGLLPEVRELTGPGGLVDLLQQAGGEFSTAEAEPGNSKGLSPGAVLMPQEAVAAAAAKCGMSAAEFVGEALTNGAQIGADDDATWLAVAQAQRQREVQHVDTDEPETSGIPPHVWLYRNMLTDQQMAAPLGRDETNGQYAVAIDQLTDAQRAIPHVAAQIPKEA